MTPRPFHGHFADRGRGLRRAALLLWLAAALALAAASTLSHAERIKDLASVRGVRDNQLVGYGLVVGLDGTGDQTTQTPFTVQGLNNMLSRLGVNLPPGTNLQLKNVAAVMVTAVLPAYAKPGQSIDVTVSSLGNAKSLRGGTLVMTQLKGADGQVYAVAQGNVVVGGFGAEGAGSKVQVNHLNVGRLPSGATVERAVPTPVGQDGFVHLELGTSDFGTAKRVADAVNAFAPGVATAVDGRVIRVEAPREPSQRVGFLAQVEALEVIPERTAAKVIVNARTGSVVMNQAVTVSAVAVAHGNLSVVISTEPVISQPAPFSPQGQTVQVERSDISIKQEGGRLLLIPNSTSLADVVKALNAIGATPQDLLAILQAMKSAGALRAELEVI